MLISLPLSKFKKVSAFVIIAFLFTCIYLYLNHLQLTHENAQWSGERCMSELTSMKYQLNVVTEYKDHIDKLLTETQNAHEAEKERHDEILETCIAIKLQTDICQSQFEDLQVESKKVTEDYKKVLKELERLKSTG